MMNKHFFISMSKDDFQTLIVDCFSDCLQHYLPKHNQPKPVDNSGFVNKKEAARLLGCSVSTIDKYRREKRLATYRLHSAVRLKRTEVLELLEQKNTRK